jgi:glycosyltransferase involved in cell wall biosynthesis
MFIHNRYRQPGGEDVALELETGLLAQKGHQVETVVFSNEQEAGFMGKLSAGWKAIYNKASAQKVKNAIRLFRPDVVHVHNWFVQASPAVFYAAAQSGVPVIMTIHNYRFVCANALLLRNNLPCELCVNKTFGTPGIRYKCYHGSAAESAMVTAITGIHKSLHTWQQKVHRYIVLTEFAKAKLLHSSFNVSPDKLVVKPNFIPDPGEGSSQREDFFLFAGRLSKEKGVQVLLEAFRELPSSRLVIIGEGPEKDAWQQAYSSAANITFAGGQPREALLGMMKRCKAVLFPSLWYEGLPFIILEAFATGTPVIASNLGAMAGLIAPGRNGLHFGPGNVQELQQAISLFEKGGEDILTMNNGARQSYVQHYHPDIHYAAIMKIYESTIAEYRSTHA